MKRIISIIIVLLPLLAAAQGGIGKRQSRHILDYLKRLEKDYVLHSLSERLDGLVVVSNKGGYGVVDLEGNIVVPLQYRWIVEQTKYNLFVLFKDTLMGVVDPTGRFVIPMEYDGSICEECYEVFNDEGLAVMMKDEKWGVLDTAGRTIVPFVYDSGLWPVGDDLMIASHYEDISHQWLSCLLHFNGDTVIAPHRSLSMWSDDLVKVWNEERLNGLYDLEGHEVVKCQYEELSYLYHGLAAVKKDGRTGVVDRTGREVIPVAENRFRGRMPDPLSANLFAVYEGNTAGVVDRWGKTVIPFEYDGFIEKTADRIVMWKNDDSYFVLDTLGTLMDVYDGINWAFEFDFIEPVTVYAVSRSGRWGMVDSSWRQVAPFKYINGDYVDARHCIMSLDNETNCLVDDRGNVVFKGPYQYIYPFCSGIWTVETTSPDGENRICGRVDAYGQTTLSRKELQTMRKWQRQRITLATAAATKPVSEIGGHYAAADTVKAAAVHYDEGDTDVDEVFVIVENNPEFPGGDSALFMYICMNLSYPEEARENKIEGLVYVSFVVAKDGSVGNVKVVRDIGGGCGAAAVEMVKGMPRWKPGTQSGKPVNTQFVLPIDFQLTDEGQPFDNVEQKCLFQYENSPWKK